MQKRRLQQTHLASGAQAAALTLGADRTPLDHSTPSLASMLWTPPAAQHTGAWQRLSGVQSLLVLREGGLQHAWAAHNKVCTGGCWPPATRLYATCMPAHMCREEFP